MDGDILFYFTYNKPDDQGGSKLEQAITNDPLWKNLSVVKENHTFHVDDTIWNTAGGILAANIMLDQLDNYLKQIK